MHGYKMFYYTEAQRVKAQGQALLMPPHLVLARSPSAPAQVQRSGACRVGGRLPIPSSQHRDSSLAALGGTPAEFGHMGEIFILSEDMVKGTGQRSEESKRELCSGTSDEKSLCFYLSCPLTPPTVAQEISSKRQQPPLHRIHSITDSA
ncbi:hypothetical protein MJT46_015537 [Ovis ammon polii x Ovis aries]|nr:hypothetical protein MJT46_015537 [Ovis ammon polii x Ovis aries]